MGFDAEVGNGAPSESEGAGTLYFGTEGKEVVSLWLREASGKVRELADLRGIPADGSVTLEKIAIATLAQIQAPLRTKFVGGGQLGKESAGSTKYFLLQNQSSAKEIEAKGGVAGIPWRIGWTAADEAIEGLTTKLKIKAKAFFASSPKVTLHVGLYKVSLGEKITLGEEVGSGLNIEIPEASSNTGISGESAEFTIAEDGDYALGMTVSGTTAQPVSVQARLLVHNVAV